MKGGKGWMLDIRVCLFVWYYEINIVDVQFRQLVRGLVLALDLRDILERVLRVSWSGSVMDSSVTL